VPISPSHRTPHSCSFIKGFDNGVDKFAVRGDGATTIQGTLTTTGTATLTGDVKVGDRG
jgi:hypothetical protein